MENRISITSIIQVYKRPEYFKELFDSIINQTIVPEKIIIVHNEGGKKFEFQEFSEKIQYVYANPNLKYHLRFLIGLLCNTEYISYHDDDSIMGLRFFENCLNTIEKHDCICVSNARNVLPDGRQTCPAGWGVPNNEEVKCWFGGHAWFFRKKTLKYMWMDDIQNYNNGEDVQLSANAWLYGKIPTYCPPHPLTDRSLWGSIDGAKKGSDSVASWLVNPIHYPERIKLIHYYLNKGWNPI